MAGITCDRKTMKNLGEKDWEAVAGTQLGGVHATCPAVWLLMIEQSHGRISNITSCVGQANYGQCNSSVAIPIPPVLIGGNHGNDVYIV
jgi:NADP-dependent 3-hydroxy acid dehydrogenase YdfG